MCSCIARILKVCNVFDIIYSKKQVKICLFKIACPLRNQVCFPHYNMKTVMGILNCLRTNAKRLISSLLCEERASGNESYQIEIKTRCLNWHLRVMLCMIHLFQLYASQIGKTILADGIV